MRLRLLHLVSAYSLWCLGTYALWIGESDKVLPYPILVVLSAVTALVVTDVTRWICMPSWFSNALGLAILVKIGWDLSGLASEALTALAHFLVYLQVAKWFREKAPFDFGLLYVMNILQLAIGAILARNTFGLILFTYFLLAIWCGILFFLARHAGEIATESYGSTSEGSLAPPRMLASLALRSGAIGALGIPLALLVFWFLPRQSRDEQASTLDGAAQQWTGFSPVVTLEKETNIVDTGEVAFHVWARDNTGSSTELPPDMLWRGSVCLRYDRGAWKRGLGRVEIADERLRPMEDPGPGAATLDIERVASTGHILFSPAGAIAATPPQAGGVIRIIPCEDRLVIDDPGNSKNTPARLTYRLVVDRSAWTSKYTSTRATDDYLRASRQVPEGLDRVRALAEQLTAGVAPTDVEGRIRRLHDYLTASGQFTYAMATENTGSDLDPIEDFLFVKKIGHCEFFAGSMALLLRYAGVPSRIVVGFKGVDANRAGGFYSVRQMLAHAWVEAYDENVRRWITIDPTPGEARESAVVRKKGWWDAVVDAKDAGVRLWQYYVVSFTFEDQRRALEGTLNWAAVWVGQPMLRLQSTLRSHWERHPGRVVVAASATSSAAVALCFAALRWGLPVARRLVLGRRGASLDRYRAIYNDWIALLARIDLRPRVGQTPWEFALAAQSRFASATRTQPYDQWPMQMADLLYRSRFGGEEPTEDQVLACRETLDRIARIL